METAAQVLLIIVSSVLSVFLIFMIVALVYAIKVLKQLRRVTEHAEVVAESIETAANNIGKATSPLAAFKLMTTIMKHAMKFSKKG